MVPTCKSRSIRPKYGLWRNTKQVQIFRGSHLRRAEVAHGEHEKRTGGGRDANWPEWYAAYMVAEQAGTELPT